MIIEYKMYKDQVCSGLNKDTWQRKQTIEFKDDIPFLTVFLSMMTANGKLDNYCIFKVYFVTYMI